MGIVLALAGRHAGAGARVAMQVSPQLTYAPANLFVRTTVDARPDNRTLEVTAESDDFYRSSQIPLAGEAAPRVSFFQFHSLPAGQYIVTASVLGVDGDALARTEVKARVIGAGEL